MQWVYLSIQLLNFRFLMSDNTGGDDWQVNILVFGGDSLNLTAGRSTYISYGYDGQKWGIHAQIFWAGQPNDRVRIL